MSQKDGRLELLRSRIRDVPDFPKKGIVFKDITPLLGDRDAFKSAIDLMVERYASRSLARIVAIESRGFILGGALAAKLGLPLAVVRKPGKLPYQSDRISYALEYGEGTLELHIDAIRKGERVLVLDDVLATGGTACAAAELTERQGGIIDEYAFLIELDFLKGREKLGDRAVYSLIRYP